MLQKEITVSDPQNDILRSIAGLNLFLAGAGSGKTTCLALTAAEYLLNFPKIIGFIGANTHDQLSKSTLKRTFEEWYDRFGWKNDLDYVVDKIPPESWMVYHQKLKSYNNTITFANGAMIFTSSMDNYSAIEGIEVGWACLDETKDTKEEAVKDVIVWRLRQKGMYIDENGILWHEPANDRRGYNPLYIFTTPAKVDWINEWFGLSGMYAEISAKIFSKTEYFSWSDKSKKVVISSTWHNAMNLPKGYIESKIEQFAGNQDKIDMLVYGSPIAKSGGEFFSTFKRMHHVKPVKYNPRQNIHISLDFNVVPYITMTIWQIEEKEGVYYVRCIDELCLSSPKNNTEDLCKEFRIKYIDGHLVNHGVKFPELFYYGDASGQNRSTLSKEHNFEQLEKVLNPWLNDKSNRVLNRNPSVIATRDFVNKILAEGYNNIRIEIGENCKNTIADFEFLKEGPDGGKLIVRAKDKSTGQSYEKYGHPSDTARYLFISAFHGIFDAE